MIKPIICILKFLWLNKVNSVEREIMLKVQSHTPYIEPHPNLSTEISRIQCK